MLIGYFVYNLGAYSGAAFQALNLAKRLSVPVVVFNVGSPLIDALPKHIRVINLTGGVLSRLLIVLKSLSSGQIKVIHFHGQFFIPMLIAKCLGVPYILKTTLLGDDDFDSLLRKRFGTLRLWLSRRCKFNIVLSERLFEINARYLDASKIKLIPNGVHVSDACPSLAEKFNHFYFCGVISKRKQTLKAIRMFALNYSHLEGAKLFVIGPIDSYGIGKEVDSKYVEE